MTCTWTLILVKHAESEYNKEGIRAGWFDVDLTEDGERQAKNIGKILHSHGYSFDIAFTSVLKRTIKTLYWIQDELDLHWVPVYKHWRLNERHAGALQGVPRANSDFKSKTYDISTPALYHSDVRRKELLNDRKYKQLHREILPYSESSLSAMDRFLPYWFDTIVPTIKSGKKVIMVTHGHILRSLKKYLDGLSDEEFPDLKPLRQGYPYIYELDQDMNPLRSYYLE